jgi:two-component system LytT family response regulator
MIVLRDKQEVTKIQIKDIIYIEAEKAYSKIVYRAPKTNQSFYASHNLAHYEELLEAHQFIRVHKSYLVNRLLISKFNLKESLVLLCDGIKIPVSRRKQALLNKTI